MRLEHILILCLGLLPACGRKPSGEFDDRPPVPMAPVALPADPVDAVDGDSGMPPDVRVGVDLRNPSGKGGPGMDPSAPDAGRKMTYTYVPVTSPRKLADQTVTEVQPAMPPPPVREPDKNAVPPPGTPIPVPPQPPGVPANGTPQP
ncbi:hypothetical protein KKD52_14465 [Myxococcota bacterium]|nr:hypothetical protein [Myxococcota bacterium]MBU1412607.1 hypothetical protein [Myxococcota bacterium]MBU1511556.1 hypothetical protein [Myxococcota bacterium]PKN26928.1 MAG: hypothetical protein CVU65_04110 [Deltaproteobacteria bacterium HGW-Deltaproteobacteria-22]